MRTVLSVLAFLFSLNCFGQNWEPVGCSDVPSMETWCYGGGLAAEISPIQEPHLFVLDTVDQTNVWQFGQTDKTFGSVSDSNYGWVTDTTNQYGADLNSDLTVLATADNWGVTWISFEHRWDTDTLMDGGEVSFSCDGLSWQNVPTNSWSYPPEHLGTYNFTDYYTQESVPTFTGRSQGWVTSAVGLQWYIPVFQGGQSHKVSNTGCTWNELDTIYFKFTFVSDNIESNNDGWIVRNITVGTHGLPSSVSGNETDVFKVYPNPNTGEFSIKLSNKTLSKINVDIYDLRGRTIYKNSYQTTDGFNKKINLNNVQSGMYILNISDGLRKSTRKIIIE